MKTSFFTRNAFLALALMLTGNVMAQTPITQTTLWTFDQFYPGDDVTNGNGTVIDYAGLYIHEHNAKGTYTKVTAENGSSYAQTTFNEKTVNMVSCLSFSNGQNTSLGATRKANKFTPDCVAFYAGVAGKVYIDIAGNSGTDRKFNVYIGGTKNESAMTSTRSVLEYDVLNEQNVFISVSEGSWKLYAVKFVPTSETPITKDITMSDMGLMTFSDTHAWTLPDGLTAYTLRAVQDGGELTTSYKISSGSAIPAMTAVILEGTHGQTYTLTATDATNAGTQGQGTALAMNNMLRPVIIDYALAGTNTIGTGEKSEWTNLILAKDGDAVVFKKSSGTGTLKAGKAFYSIRTDQVKYASASARIILDLNSDETTEIRQVEGHQSTTAEYYTLSGQRVSKPTKGLYVVNGKKVMFK